MITVNNESVEVLIEDKKFDLPFLWLRDNCQCDECRITETQEKQFLLHTVPIDISPDKVDMDGDMLLIKWPDGHDSIIPTSKILECGAPRYPDYKFWSKKFTPNRFTWKDFHATNKRLAAMYDKEDVEQIKKNIADTQATLRKKSAEPEKIAKIDPAKAATGELFDPDYNLDPKSEDFEVFNAQSYARAVVRAKCPGKFDWSKPGIPLKPGKSWRIDDECSD